MRVRAWFLMVLALAVLAGGCERKRGYRADSDLCRAARQGDVQKVRSLIARGVSIHTTDHDGQTPLHNAALRGHREVIELLLTHGADPDARNSRGRTPLDDAARRGHKDIVRLLTARSGGAAETTQRDNDSVK